MKNGFKNLKLAAVALLITGAYWLSYGMTGAERRVSIATEQARAQAEQKAKSAGLAPVEVKEAGRKAAVEASQTAQVQIEQEYVARGRRPSIARTQTQVVTQPAAQPVASATESLVSWSPVDLMGERRVAVLIIDEQFDFMQLAFKENALGKQLSDGQNDFTEGRLAVVGANQQFLNAQRTLLEAFWALKIARVLSQDWHKPGSVSFNTSYENKKDGTHPAIFAPLGANAGEYKAVGAPGNCEGVEKLSSDSEKRKTQVAIIEEQVLWPKHCMQGTRGAEMPDELFADGSYAKVKNAQPSVAPKPGVAPQGYQSSKGLEFIVEKGVHCHVDSYSALLDNDRKTKTELESIFLALGITDVFLKGIATDFCVGSSAVHTIESGRNVHMLVNLCRGVFANDAANPHVNMVKMVKKLAGLVGPNGARAYFYVITDLNDGDAGNIKTETLLKDAGLWDQTNKLTLAELMDFVKSLHGKKAGAAATPVTPAVPAYTDEEPTLGWSEEEEEKEAARPLFEAYQKQLTQNILSSIDTLSFQMLPMSATEATVVKSKKGGSNAVVIKAKPERSSDGNAIYYRITWSAPEVVNSVVQPGTKQTPLIIKDDVANKVFVIEDVNYKYSFDKNDGSLKSADEKKVKPAPAAGVKSADNRDVGLAKQYEKQKLDTVATAPKLKDGVVTVATDNYISTNIKMETRVFKVLPGGSGNSIEGYKIEFRDNTYEYGSDMNLIVPAAPTTLTLADRYEAQKTQSASDWSGVNFKDSLDTTALNTTAGEYASTNIPVVSVGGAAPLVYKQADSGWKIELKDAVYEYDADGNPAVSVVAPPVVIPAAAAVPAKQEDLLALEYNLQKTQNASAWKAADFKRNLAMDKLTIVGDYGKIGVAAGGAAPFVYKKTRSPLGDQWMIEFKDFAYRYDAVSGEFVSEQDLSAPAVPVDPVAAGALLFDPFSPAPGASAKTATNFQEKYEKQLTQDVLSKVPKNYITAGLGKLAKGAKVEKRMDISGKFVDELRLKTKPYMPNTDYSYYTITADWMETGTFMPKSGVFFLEYDQDSKMYTLQDSKVRYTFDAAGQFLKEEESGALAAF